MIPARLTVESWRFLPHSYAIVNQFQCLELLKRSDLSLSHRDLPFYNASWQPMTGLFDEVSEAALRTLPAPDAAPTDATLRIAFPYDLTPANSRRTAVFATAEFGAIPPRFLLGAPSLAKCSPELLLLTPSSWSRDGLLRGGARPEQVAVVPHGFDPTIFHPLSPEERDALRARLGWGGFVFLNVGSMTGNKGLPLLLESFAAIADRHPEVRLVLKGLDPIYRSEQLLRDALQKLGPAANLVASRLSYNGEALSFAALAQLYQAADAYVAPYSGEGFNLPALEALACGLPLLCTDGGATDDFTDPAFALRIESQLHELPLEGGAVGCARIPIPSHLVHLMETLVEKPTRATELGQLGAAHAHAHFTWRQVVDQLLPLLTGTAPAPSSGYANC